MRYILSTQYIISGLICSERSIHNCASILDSIAILGSSFSMIKCVHIYIVHVHVMYMYIQCTCTMILLPVAAARERASNMVRCPSCGPQSRAA